MKKTAFLVSLLATTALLGACGDKKGETASHSNDQKQSTVVTKKKATSKAAAPRSAAETATQETKNQTTASTDQDSVAASQNAQSGQRSTDSQTKNGAASQQSTKDTTSTSDSQSNSKTGNDLSIPATVLSAYRTALGQAGLDSNSFSDAQLNAYYLEAKKSGDVGTLLQFVARDRGMDANQLLNSYYSYNGMNTNGSDKAQMPASQLQAYKTAITQAGLDASSFSDSQLNGYYQESHLTGDIGTLLQLIARDRGLDANQLLANYYKYNGQNQNGSEEAQMPTDMLQAYRNVITQAGLDASSFSDSQLNGYYREAHLSGDPGTLLQFVARDRGLDFNQLLAKYQGQ